MLIISSFFFFIFFSFPYFCLLFFYLTKTKMEMDKRQEGNEREFFTRKSFRFLLFSDLQVSKP